MTRKSKVKTARSGKNYASFITAFKKQVKVQGDALTEEASLWLVDHIRDAIKNQRFKWVPLDEAYVKRKSREGKDERIYIATSELLRNIIAWKDRAGVIHVGPAPDKIHTASGLPFGMLMRILEFGTATIPARPLFRPALSNLLRFNKDFEIVYQQSVIKESTRRVKSLSPKRKNL